MNRYRPPNMYKVCTCEFETLFCTDTHLIHLARCRMVYKVTLATGDFLAKKVVRYSSPSDKQDQYSRSFKCNQTRLVNKQTRLVVNGVKGWKMLDLTTGIVKISCDVTFLKRPSFPSFPREKGHVSNESPSTETNQISPVHSHGPR